MAVDVFESLWTFVQGLWSNHMLILAASGSLGLVLGVFLIWSLVRFLVMPFLGSPGAAMDPEVSFADERVKRSGETGSSVQSQERGLVK